MDGDELELFRTSLARATADHTGAALDAALEDLGWRDALATDRRAAVATLLPLQGAANATSAALDHVLAAALGVDPGPAVGVVLPALGDVDPPGTGAGEALAVRGLGTAHLARCATAVVVAPAGAGAGHVVATVDVGGLALRPVGGLDPGAGAVEVTGAGVRAATRVAAAPGSPAGWPGAVAAGQLAVAHELVGAAGAMLDLACDHARERIQFGRPIGSFQAVRHRLAESLVAVEAAASAADAAWDAGTPLAAALAKAIAGRSARTVARHAQQVLAGIGFTTEHPLHRHVRRVLLLDGVLGSARTLGRRLGEDLLRERRLPSLLPL